MVHALHRHSTCVPRCRGHASTRLARVLGRWSSQLAMHAHRGHAGNHLRTAPALHQSKILNPFSVLQGSGRAAGCER